MVRDNGKFLAKGKVLVDGKPKTVSLGTFLSFEEARIAAANGKTNYVKELGEKYSSQLSSRVIEAISKYDALGYGF